MANHQQQHESASVTPLPTHLNLHCDECGVSPLVGVRYKSKLIHDYDLCETCMNDASNLSERHKYVAIHFPISHREAAKIGPKTDTSLQANSFRQAAEKIAQNCTEEFANLQIWDDDIADTDGEKIRAALASNTHLTILNIHMCHLPTSAKLGKAIVSVAKGIMASTSIRRVFWYIPPEERKASCATALREMMENNSVLEALFLDRVCQSSDAKNETDAAEDKFADILFKGLETNTSIKRFRLEGYHVLSENTKDTLLAAVQKNNSIGRLEVEFEETNGRLELVLASKREKWVERFSDTSVAAGSRLGVLLEARDYGRTVDPVSATFHVLRTCPEFVSVSSPKKKCTRKKRKFRQFLR